MTPIETAITLLQNNWDALSKQQQVIFERLQQLVTAAVKPVTRIVELNTAIYNAMQPLQQSFLYRLFFLNDTMKKQALTTLLRLAVIGHFPEEDQRALLTKLKSRIRHLTIKTSFACTHAEGVELLSLLQALTNARELVIDQPEQEPLLQLEALQQLFDEVHLAEHVLEVHEKDPRHYQCLHLREPQHKKLIIHLINCTTTQFYTVDTLGSLFGMSFDSITIYHSMTLMDLHFAELQRLRISIENAVTKNIYFHPELSFIGTEKPTQTSKIVRSIVSCSDKRPAK